MKTLSARQAQSCEDAKRPKCVCRCGGRLHGAKRSNVCDLPVLDPHYPGKPCPACGGDGKCQRCRGTGRFRYIERDGEESHKCWVCNETGKCKRCGGTGGVLRKEAREKAEQVRRT